MEGRESVDGMDVSGPPAFLDRDCRHRGVLGSRAVSREPATATRGVVSSVSGSGFAG
jgi:hypothetical protein